MSKTSTRENKAFQLIREGLPDNTITLLTGYSPAVIQAMRKDLRRIEGFERIERIDRHRKERE